MGLGTRHIQPSHLLSLPNGGGGKAGVQGPGLLFRTCEERYVEEEMGQDLCLGVQMADSVLVPWGDCREGKQKL